MLPESAHAVDIRFLIQASESILFPYIGDEALAGESAVIATRNVAYAIQEYIQYHICASRQNSVIYPV